MQLDQLISVKTTLSKSIKELLESYVLTSTVMQNIQNVIQVIKNQTALEYIKTHNSVVQQDPVVQRGFKLYSVNVERKITSELNKIVENPVSWCWYQGQNQHSREYFLPNSNHYELFKDG